MEDIKGFFQDGKHSFLSNFYPSNIKFMGVDYPTVEHFYQAAKSFFPGEAQLIAEADRPGEAKRYGRKVSLHPDWENIKLSVMELALRLKFSNPIMMRALLETECAYLEETNSWGDVEWGVCNGIGKNYLGILLMRIRDELRIKNQCDFLSEKLEELKIRNNND